MAQAIVRKYDGPTSYRTIVKLTEGYEEIATSCRTTQYYEIRTIACGHFVRRTSVFYTRTIACAVACDRAIGCADPYKGYFHEKKSISHI